MITIDLMMGESVRQNSRTERWRVCLHVRVRYIHFVLLERNPCTPDLSKDPQHEQTQPDTDRENI